MEFGELVAALKPAERRLRDDFGVVGLYVFGSVVRGKATEDSDIDLLVDFAGSPTFAGFMELKFLLEGLLHARVDLATRGALRPVLRDAIEAEARRVA